MKNNLQGLLKKYLVSLIFLIFTCLFFKSKQYLFSFLTLSLILITQRLDSIKKIGVNSKGFVAEFVKNNEKLSKIIKSNKPVSEKISESQKLIDEAFRLGFISGGGKPFNDIWDVKIIRDKDGKVTGCQYNEN